MKKNLDRQLALAFDGRITFAAFVAATRTEFVAMACSLMKRWIPPASMAPDDLVQELYLGAWLCMWDFDATRGPSITQYVVYNAMSFAKRELHKARGAKLSGSADRNPSRMERPLASFGDDGDAISESILAEEPIAEQVMIAFEDRAAAVARALAACTTSREVQAISAIVTAGDVHAGACAIFNDMHERIELRLSSEEHAARYVVQTAAAVTRRLADASAS